jgi:prolyl oligopeptidase
MDLIYPQTRRTDQKDNYHGAWIADPYRWLEDVDSPESLDWIAEQNQLTFSFLEDIPARSKIHQRLTELWDYPKMTDPVRRGGRYFTFRNSGLLNQDQLYVLESLEDEGRLLLDPNVLSEDGTVALANWSISRDGRFLAYATSDRGSDWLTWRVREVSSGDDLADAVFWSKFCGAAWLPDGSGFYYSRYAEPELGRAYEGLNYHQKLYFHKVGTAQSEDILVYERPDQKEWGFDSVASEDGCYLVVHIWLGTDTRNRVFYKDLEKGGEFVELIPNLEARYSFIGNDGHVFYFHTDQDAPRGRIIAIDTLAPGKQNWKTLVPQLPDTLELVKLAHNEFVTLYLHDAYHIIRRYSLEGDQLGTIELPTLGSILSINGKTHLFGNREEDEIFYTFHSFACPPTVYRFDLHLGTSQVLYTPPVNFDFSGYETRQVFVTSKDGTKVPMFLIHRKDQVWDGSSPTLLYGYGGFNISIPPMFAISRLIWLELGGVIAWACLRGGGEYGEDWHQAGMLQNKQNVFDDFIACAEYLIAEKITSPERLAIQGRSNGGLLVGACMNQRPELFGAALPGVGVMDMLRFHKFTIGWAWVSDYGSAEDPEGFKTLIKYSPLHNIQPGTHYPATLITTADHDDRVVPGHSFKFAAALQAAQAGEAPVLIRIQTRAGHGFGKPTSILIEEETDQWAFLVKVLRMEEEKVVT